MTVSCRGCVKAEGGWRRKLLRISLRSGVSNFSRGEGMRGSSVRVSKGVLRGEDQGGEGRGRQDDGSLVGTGGFNGGQLRVEQGGVEKVAGTVGQALGKCGPVNGEVDEADLSGGAGCAQDVAVGAAQGGAGEDGAGAAGEVFVEDLAQVRQPRGAVGVGQGVAGSHLGTVGGRMEGVGIEKRKAELSGEGGTDGGLATAGDPHDDDGPRWGRRGDVGESLAHGSG